ncbi:tRNA (guanosine(37)-N1)-methyltransferase TrmD [Spiroplasma endosymbiont of Agriotes lineatus]|uniref:tRNA (guanosine(37)-N1)-methyltransferase TrmD n=1 Tax=Spiroplasma endosymbiont of Agriotes lineatus TaxID=3077930 RepID=UPI0030CF6306
MTTIQIITLFPEIFVSFINTSIIKNAVKKEKIKFNIINLRDFAVDKHQQVDDYQYGGGNGMVLMAPIVVAAINYARKQIPNSQVILLSPQGKTFKQHIASEIASSNNSLILVCGHYEGFDERIRDFVDIEISIGDYVLSAGEIASMVISDAVIRLLPGVIQESSHQNDSFTSKYLDYPVFTKPLVFNDQQVPDVLLSGYHKNIDIWRKQQAFYNTYKKRPDLIDLNQLTPQEQIWIAELEKDKK